MQKQILIVDDEILILKSLQADLEQEGYDVAVASNGEEALAQLARKSCDIMITDMMMDGMNGIELIQKIREQKNDIPVIIITAYGELETAIAALRLDAADYLLKPFHTEELLMRIRNCLEKQELMRKIKVYENILPICMFCKKIRDDAGKERGKGDWQAIEEYLAAHGDLRVSHGLCPECYNEHYSDIPLNGKKKG